MSDHHLPRSSVAQVIRRLSVPIALFWLALAAITNAVVPQLEALAKEQNVSLSPQDAPSLQAMKHMGKVFQEFDSDSVAMVVLEGDKPLGDDAHRFTTPWSTSSPRTPNTYSTSRTSGGIC